MPRMNWPTTEAGAPKALSELTPPERTRAFEITKVRLVGMLPSGANTGAHELATAAWLTLLLRNAYERAKWTVSQQQAAK